MSQISSVKSPVDVEMNMGSGEIYKMMFYLDTRYNVST